ncbi:purine-cytosine permease family protein [Arthrobacter sp. VKM Ac-2550]|uniref:purine-cytosine permease family protein n=1 Tax=Crystallibacter permensis TaxID=1938888 RepID=UPI00222601B9|nr:permease [Arthrobacter sp. VKM Ac-2550]MCW2134360.1 Purine-cytosine permease [Arthrobacter sp. VKM Ac-2550]
MSSTEALPQETSNSTRMSRGSLTMAWYGLVSAMFFVYIGAALAQAYGTRDALIGLGLTILSYGLINRVLAGYALRNGLTVAQFSRSLLGRTGALLATIIFAATAIYYAVFEGAILAFAFQAQFGGPMALWYAVVVLYTLPLVAGGIQRWLDKINGWLLPVYWGGLIAAVIWAGTAHGFSDDWLTHSVPVLGLAEGGPGWLGTFAAFMGVWILMMYTMDFAALGRPRDEKFHKTYTFGWLFYALAFGANALIGIFLTFTIPGLEATETGVAGGLVSLMGLFGLLVVFVSQTRINTANYALGISNLREFGERAFKAKLPRIVWNLLGAGIIFLLMLLPVVQYLLVALSWQGALVTGWVAIALTHIALDRRSGRPVEPGHLPDSSFPKVNAAGVAAWCVSAVVGIGLVQSGLAWGSTAGTLVTPLLAAAIYASIRLTSSNRALQAQG